MANMKKLEPPYRAIAISMFSGIDSIRGTILDPDNEDSIWDEVSPTEVRLKSDTDITEDAVREIAGGDFNRVWAIFRQSDYYPPAEIMEGCFQGEEVLITAFCKKYRNYVYSIIHSWMRAHKEHSPDDVDEIFQIVFTKLIDNNFALLRIVRDINRPTGLISAITHSCTAKYFKTKWHNALMMASFDVIIDGLDESEGLVCNPDQQALLAEAEKLRIYEEAFADLDEVPQKVLNLRRRSNLSYREIATETGLTTANVGAIINRAKKQMQDFIRERYPDIDIPEIL